MELKKQKSTRKLEQQLPVWEADLDSRQREVGFDQCILCTCTEISHGTPINMYNDYYLVKNKIEKLCLVIGCEHWYM